MTILPSLDIIEKYVSNSRDRAFVDVNNILFNENVDILLTKSYLDFLEENIDNIEILRTLVTELSDNNRIAHENIIDNNNENIFEDLYTDNCDRIDCLFAITLNTQPNILHYRHSQINKINKNIEFILFSLLISSILSLHYYDFTDNNKIQNFLKTVFKLPKKIGRITIFNRYSEYDNFEFLKGKSIHYYNLIPKNNKRTRQLEYIAIESNLKSNLGKNLVLKSVGDLTKIHERKIFFNHFFITFDQAFSNLQITEPNWKIDVEIDRKKCFLEWTKKIVYFSNLN
ncbi:hypothetical protein [Chryseobacterium sp. OV279]|uniref:hypothetical protein n=1 Tax=Chryseobacterium sp. OV279 TaxID=1500285 RepID=UPI00091544EC|nr:hypothetical protein [Chryseobacterium sp. OV279]SHF09740.1 hypothetical protein SAMN02787100_1543 [Chryseobacterium sp. OV279]